MVTETEFNVYQYRDTSVENGKNYTYRVTALNDQGESPVSDVEWAIPAGVPLKPRNVGVTEVNGTLVVEWNPPADSNGANVKSYQILRARGEGNMAVIAELEAENDKYRDVDVEIAVEYTYALKARNIMGLSRISDSAAGSVYSIPGSPTNIDAVQNSEGIRLSWAAPEMTGGLEIDYYEILVPDNADGGWKELDTVESGRTEYTHTDIVAGTTYRYAVIAHNSRGESPLSDEVTVTPTGSPGAPLSVVLKETEEGNLKISWGSPRNDGGEPILHYMVERSVDEGEYEMVAIVLNSSTNYVDKNIEKGHTYSYRVVAENVRGGSEPSEVAGITMDEEAREFSMDSIPGPVYIGIIIALLVLVVALSLFTLMRRKRGDEQVAEPTPVTSDVNQGYVNGYGGPDAGQDPYYQQGYTDQYAE
jgi:titin